ncbi:hypothetical protein GCM10023347_21070 [Streptomyces chumphonensis]|uniref:Septum formation-related domain-containing protein n=1 Tax=Streptomyces chumphonensis TaxID=1214925 RepID=A0A927I9Y1_9ACTN|nr:hypothetical protein [Streptomyces chumphonensis]MBD3930193.1 hypothetical protein [Streptomyces chumphonensis]
MSYPPPPNNHSGSGAGGGFGPPQGFGPPEQPGPPAGGYGYPQQPHQPGPPDGYGYPGQPGQPGGYPGQPPYGGPGIPGGPPGPPGGPGGYPPPPPSGGNGPKVAVIVIAAVLVAALAVGGILIATSGDDEPDVKADSSATPTASGTPDPEESSDAPTGEPSDEATDDPFDIDVPTESPYLEFEVLDPGTCFDHPTLSSDVTEIEEKSCSEPHDAEVITNITLSGDYADDSAIGEESISLCEKDAQDKVNAMPADGKVYYPFALYPLQSTYEYQGEDTVSCALTISDAQDGDELTGSLP